MYKIYKYCVCISQFLFPREIYSINCYFSSLSLFRFIINVPSFVSSLREQIKEFFQRFFVVLDLINYREVETEIKKNRAMLYIYERIYVSL